MIKVAIVDDEKAERDKLTQMFEVLKNRSELFKQRFSLSFFENGDQLLFDFTYGRYDLIFLDIDLSSSLNGIQVAEAIRKIDVDAIIVFLTNLAQYALDGYKVNAFDYMLKPIAIDDFISKMKTITDKLEKKMTEKVVIQTNGAKIILQIKDIYYIEVANHQTIYHTSKGDFKTYGALKEIVKELGPFNFSLCNSCFLVNLEYVEEVLGYDLIVKGNKILISHPKRKAFLSDLNKFLGM